MQLEEQRSLRSRSVAAGHAPPEQRQVSQDMLLPSRNSDKISAFIHEAEGGEHER